MDWLSKRLEEFDTKASMFGLIGGGAGVEMFADNPIMILVAYGLMILSVLGVITPDKA